MKLDFLHTVYALPPPYASLYIETARSTEDAFKAVELRWRRARESLGAAGADAATLDAMERIVTDPDRAAPGCAVFAAGGRVGYTEPLPGPPPPLAEWTPLPRTLPLVFLRDEPIPHLQVLVDRQGADISVCGPRRRTTTIRGRDWPLQKVHEGGWSEARYQRSAVETWEANAKQVAETVSRQADAYHAQLIVVGGDVRARELLMDRLPERHHGHAVTAAHGARAAGIDREMWDAEVADLLRSYRSRRRSERIAAFREGHGRGDAVAGLAEVVAALRAGQADVVLVNDPAASGLTGTLWYGPAPTALARTEREAKDLGLADPAEDDAGSVLVRAMVGTGVSVEPVDRRELDLPEGVGALLRFSL